MVLTVIFCLIVFYLSIQVDYLINNFFGNIRSVFGHDALQAVSVIYNSQPNLMQQFCPTTLKDMEMIAADFELLYYLMLYSLVGFLTSIIQKIIVWKMRDNVELNVARIFLEIGLVVASFLFIRKEITDERNTLISDKCATVVDISMKEKENIDKTYV